MPQYDDWPCCGPPLVPLQGTCVVKYDHNDNFSEPNLSKLASNEQISQIVQNQDFMCKIDFFPPIIQVLIENMHAGFKMVCTILLEGQKHPFWPKTPLFWPFFKQFLALDPKNSVLCAKILLLHGIPGYNLHRIWWGRFLSKKSSQEPFEIAIFAWNSGIEAVLALLTNFFTKITPKFPQIRTDHVVGPHM